MSSESIIGAVESLSSGGLWSNVSVTTAEENNQSPIRATFYRTILKLLIRVVRCLKSSNDDGGCDAM